MNDPTLKVYFLESDQTLKHYDRKSNRCSKIPSKESPKSEICAFQQKMVGNTFKCGENSEAARHHDSITVFLRIKTQKEIEQEKTTGQLL